MDEEFEPPAPRRRVDWLAELLHGQPRQRPASLEAQGGGQCEEVQPVYRGLSRAVPPYSLEKRAGTKRPRNEEIESLCTLATMDEPDLEQARELCRSDPRRVQEKRDMGKVTDVRPLHLAVSKSHAQLVDLLLEHTSLKDVKAPTSMGKPAMFFAVRNALRDGDCGNLNIIRKLRLAGADCLSQPHISEIKEYVVSKEEMGLAHVNFSTITEEDHGVDLHYERMVEEGTRRYEKGERGDNGSALRQISPPLSDLACHSGMSYHDASSEREMLRAEREWLWAEREFHRSFAGLYSTKYLFDVMRVVKVEQRALNQKFEQKKAELQNDEDADTERRTVFHGTQRSSLKGIVADGLRPGRASVQHYARDGGFFGDSTQGIYVTQCADYAMFYCAAHDKEPVAEHLEERPPPDYMAIVMLDCVLGRSKRMTERKTAIQPEAGYHSNQSPTKLEYFLYSEDMCTPRYVLHIARRNRVQPYTHFLHE